MIKTGNKTLATFTRLTTLCLLLVVAQATGGISGNQSRAGARSLSAARTAPDRLSAALPDLTVKRIKIVRGKAIKVVVRNLGGKASTRCFLSIKVFEGILSDVLYSTRLEVPAIPPGREKVLLFNVKGRPLEGNSIKAVVDATNVVAESDEENNEDDLITAP